jgi:hypothetical protein
MLLPLVEAMNIQMFNRITRVEIDNVSDLSTRLGKHDMSELDHLGHIVLTRVTNTPGNLARISELKDSLPCEKIKLEAQSVKLELSCSL